MIEAGDEAVLDRITVGAEHDRDAAGRALGGERSLDSSGRDDDIHFAADKIGRQPREPLQLTLRPAVFESDVATFGVARIHEPEANEGETIAVGLGVTAT